MIRWRGETRRGSAAKLRRHILVTVIVLAAVAGWRHLSRGRPTDVVFAGHPQFRGVRPTSRGFTCEQRVCVTPVREKACRPICCRAHAKAGSGGCGACTMVAGGTKRHVRRSSSRSIKRKNREPLEVAGWSRQSCSNVLAEVRFPTSACQLRKRSVCQVGVDEGPTRHLAAHQPRGARPRPRHRRRRRRPVQSTVPRPVPSLCEALHLRPTEVAALCRPGFPAWRLDARAA